MMKKFYGTIEVTPKSTQFKPFRVTSEFEYDEHFDAWHGNNNYYLLEQTRIIEVIKEINNNESKL